MSSAIFGCFVYPSPSTPHRLETALFIPPPHNAVFVTRVEIFFAVSSFELAKTIFMFVYTRSVHGLAFAIEMLANFAISKTFVDPYSSGCKQWLSSDMKQRDFRRYDLAVVV